jgi:hypothetical protein
MKHIEFSTPAPSCLVPLLHPSRVPINFETTDVQRIWREHTLEEDYERTEAHKAERTCHAV